MTFLVVAGKNAPAFTVASLATIMHGTPSTLPMPVTTPAAGYFAPLLIHFVCGPEFDLEKRRVLVEQMPNPLAHRQASHFPLALMPGLSAAFTQDRFLLRNRSAMRAQHFTRARSSHMPEPRLICARD